MPNCVVKGCKYHSSRDKKQDGITFHTFPDRYENIKQKWIAVLQQSRKEPSWQPTSRSLICSTHFKTEDLYYTKKGLRRVVRNGYPKILPNVLEGLENEDYSHPPAVQDDPAVPDLWIEVDLNQPTTSCAVQTAASADLSVLDSTQGSNTCTVQPVPANSPIFDTPRNHKLRKRVLLLEKKLDMHQKKIKSLNQKVRRLHERNKSLKKIIKVLTISKLSLTESL